MKFNFLIVVILAYACLWAAAEERASVVRFVNGDKISGRLESLTRERLVWDSPILENPTSFFLKAVLDITLVPKPPNQDANHEAMVALTNGDTVNGQLLAVSEEGVELETWFAGRMKFPRVMVRSIEINEKAIFLYEGPNGIDEWTHSSEPPAWSYQHASLISNSSGSIAKDVKLPDECRISFDAAWRGLFGLKLLFFSDQLKSENPSNGYEISFQQRAIFARSCKTGATLGPGATAPALQENEKAKIEVRASLVKGTVAVFVNGEIIGVWTDPDMAQNAVGRGIHFVAINSAPVRISQIGVGAWDGVLEKMPEPPRPGGFRNLEGFEEDAPQEAEVQVKDESRMLLRNGDSITGEVVGIEQEMIRIKTPFKEVKLPLAVLKSVTLKPIELERCKRENGDVRAWFPDGTSMVFRLESVGEESWVGYSQNFGTAEFKVAAFSRVEFNIYERKYDELRVDSSW